MRYAKSHRAETRTKVVQTATRAFQRDGIDGTGLAGLMGEAGLTKGGFYAHFTSKDALVAEAATVSLQASADRMRARANAAAASGGSALDAIIDAYLSSDHVRSPEGGCAIGALLSDLSRGAPVVREAGASGAARLVEAIDEALPSSLGPDRRPRAQAIFGMLAGCLQLARLEPEGARRDAILSGARDAARLLGAAPSR